MVEDAITAASTIKILVGAVAVGEVIGRSIGTCGEGTWRTTCDADNLPTGHYTVASIIVGSNIVIVRQLYLVVVEVEMCSILVGDVEDEA